MNAHSVIAMIVAGLTAALVAQTPAAPPLDYEARVKSVVTLKEEVINPHSPLGRAKHREAPALRTAL
jgi:hypothetical protein